MAEFVSSHAPNRLTATNTDNSTNPLIIGISGTGYATLAACIAAGDRPFPFASASTPGLDTGMGCQSVTVENVTGARSISVAWNTGVAPTADNMTLVPGGSQFTIPGPVGNVWIIKSTGTDHVCLTALY